MMKLIRNTLTTVGLLGVTFVATAQFTVKTMQNTPIYAKIADEYRKVGELSANQQFTVQQPTLEQKIAQGQLMVHFGNEKAVIADKHVLREAVLDGQHKSAVEKMKI